MTMIPTLALPIQFGPVEHPTRTILLIVLNRENIDRLCQHDPFSCNLRELPEPHRSWKFDEVHVAFGTDAEMEYALNMRSDDDLIQFLKMIGSGHRRLPGDDIKPIHLFSKT